MWCVCGLTCYEVMCLWPCPCSLLSTLPVASFCLPGEIGSVMWCFCGVVYYDAMCFFTMLLQFEYQLSVHGALCQSSLTQVRLVVRCGWIWCVCEVVYCDVVWCVGMSLWPCCCSLLSSDQFHVDGALCQVRLVVWYGLTWCVCGVVYCDVFVVWYVLMCLWLCCRILLFTLPPLCFGKWRQAPLSQVGPSQGTSDGRPPLFLRPFFQKPALRISTWMYPRPTPPIFSLHSDGCRICAVTQCTTQPQILEFYDTASVVQNLVAVHLIQQPNPCF